MLKLVFWFKNYHYILSLHLLFIINLWNFIVTPIMIVYRYDYPQLFILIEMISIAIISINIGFIIFKLKNNSRLKLKLLFNIYYAIPFALIFSIREYNPYWIVIVVVFNRICNPFPIIKILNFYKKNFMKYLMPLRLFEILICFMIGSHIIACLFLEVGFFENDRSMTWMKLLPVPNANFDNPV